MKREQTDYGPSSGLYLVWTVSTGKVHRPECPYAARTRTVWWPVASRFDTVDELRSDLERRDRNLNITEHTRQLCRRCLAPPTGQRGAQ